MESISIGADNCLQYVNWQNSSSQILLSPLEEVLSPVSRPFLKSERVPLYDTLDLPSSTQPQTAVEFNHDWLLGSCSSPPDADLPSNNCNPAVPQREDMEYRYPHQIPDWGMSAFETYDGHTRSGAPHDRIRSDNGPTIFSILLQSSGSYSRESMIEDTMAMKNLQTNSELDYQMPVSMRLALADLAQKYGTDFLPASQSPKEVLASKNAPNSNNGSSASAPPLRTRRAKRGCATNPRSIAERLRRIRISERLRKLQNLLPSRRHVGLHLRDTADMLEEAVQYVKYLQRRVQQLSKTICAGDCQMHNKKQSPERCSSREC